MRAPAVLLADPADRRMRRSVSSLRPSARPAAAVALCGGCRGARSLALLARRRRVGALGGGHERARVRRSVSSSAHSLVGAVARRADAARRAPIVRRSRVVRARSDAGRAARVVLRRHPARGCRADADGRVARRRCARDRAVRRRPAGHGASHVGRARARRAAACGCRSPARWPLARWGSGARAAPCASPRRCASRPPIAIRACRTSGGRWRAAASRSSGRSRAPRWSRSSARGVARGESGRRRSARGSGRCCQRPSRRGARGRPASPPRS